MPDSIKHSQRAGGELVGFAKCAKSFALPQELCQSITLTDAKMLRPGALMPDEKVRYCKSIKLSTPV
jgi:hypothetical protein